MQRRILAFLLVAAAPFAAFAASCTADLSENCLSGPCGPGSLDVGGSSSGAGGADGGDEGGINACVGMDPPATGDFPCAVFDVINRNCRPCHQIPTQQGAPFPLMTFENTQLPYPDVPTRKIYQQMNIQIRPGAIPRMPLGGALNDADLKVLTDWLNGCAQPVAEGTGCECPGMGCTP